MKSLGKYTYYLLNSDGELTELDSQREVLAAIKEDDFDKDTRIFRGVELSYSVEETTVRKPTLTRQE